jgi:hypothetical protein
MASRIKPEHEQYILNHFWMDRDTYRARQWLTEIVEQCNMESVRFLEKLVARIQNDENRMI